MDDSYPLSSTNKIRQLREKASYQRETIYLVLDRLVLARSAFNSSMEYRSVTLFGTPRLFEGSEAKLRAMRIISEHTMPGRWDELREPHDREIKMTGVIALAGC